MTEMLKDLREKSQKRKKLLVQTLGVSNIDELRQTLGTGDTPTRKSQQGSCSKDEVSAKKQKPNESSVDEMMYMDSSTFLKGTQSSNPHNDYCQHFVDTGQRPQNFIRDVGLADRFEEYPKLRELIKLKDDLIAQTATPPMYLRCDLAKFDFKELGTKFDVVLIEPPLEEYQRSLGVTNMEFWNWEQIMNLDIGEVVDVRGFVFLWCGSSQGLDMGRNCLRKWGFRRCEDICWIRTNVKNPGHSKNLDGKNVFQRTKEHCLMGIKGTVRRSTDGDFIHANVDIDLIISEETEYGSLEKPVEIFHIIEHFCLGRRRLHLFGRDSTIRPEYPISGSNTSLRDNIVMLVGPKLDLHKAISWDAFYFCRGPIFMAWGYAKNTNLYGIWIAMNEDLYSPGIILWSIISPLYLPNFLLALPSNLQISISTIGKELKSENFICWVTLGPELTNSNFTTEWYASYFVNGEVTTGCTERIEALRPKSPPPKGKGGSGSRGRGGSSRGTFSRGRGRVSLFSHQVP